MKFFKRYWGYLLLTVVAYGFLTQQLGPGAIAAVAGCVVVYTLFQAPVWCCAETRQKGLCRNNANGLMMGCHLREHKWQKFKMVVHKSSWGRLVRRMVTGFGAQAASFSALAGLTSAVAAVITLYVKKQP